jgi:hypothetical protein
MFITLFILGLASNVKPQELKFEVLKSSSRPSPSELKGIYTFDSRSDFLEIWEEVSSTDLVSQIDFNTDMIIAIFRGVCPSLSYSVFIEKIEENKDSIFVFVQYLNPGENCRQSLAISSPYIIIKIKKSFKQIEFVEREKIKECK